MLFSEAKVKGPVEMANGELWLEVDGIERLWSSIEE